MPKTVDEYLTSIEKFPGQKDQDQILNPVWHVHNGKPPTEKNSNTFLNVIKFSWYQVMQIIKKFLEVYK